MAPKLIVDVLADTRDATKNIERFSRSTDQQMGKMRSGFKKFGAAATAAFAFVGTRAVVDFGKELYSLGRQVEAWGVKSNAVFKDHRDEVERWAEDNRRNFGVGGKELEGYVAELGQMLAAQGFVGDELADTSIAFADLAGQASLLSGGTVSMTEALDKFTALLRGERDPVESLGVSIRQSDINARLAADGLGDLTGEARKMAEATASLEIAQEQLADQFAETGEISGEEMRAMASDAASAREDISTAWAGLVDDIAIHTVEMGSIWSSGQEKIDDDTGDWFRDLNAKARNFWTEFIGNFAQGWHGLDMLNSSWTARIAYAIGQVQQVLWHSASMIIVWIQTVASFFQTAWGVISAIPGQISNLGVSIRGLVNDVGSVLNPLNWFDDGGVVPGPRGSAQLAVVHGGETILPTHKAGGASMGGNTYNITVQAVAASAEVGEAIVDAIDEYERFGGKGWRSA